MVLLSGKPHKTANFYNALITLIDCLIRQILAKVCVSFDIVFFILFYAFRLKRPQPRRRRRRFDHVELLDGDQAGPEKLLDDDFGHLAGEGGLEADIQDVGFEPHLEQRAGLVDLIGDDDRGPADHRDQQNQTLDAQPQAG